MTCQTAIHCDTPFHLLVGACELEDAERLLPVFASSAMEVFPFQVAAANFALKAELGSFKTMNHHRLAACYVVYTTRCTPTRSRNLFE